jgi:drug/metabolite transporter (DMT)-like permease
LSAVAALFLKKASDAKLKLINFLFFNLHFYIGLGLYFFASLGSIIALKYLPYGIVYALSSTTYVWTLVLSRIFLSEKITRNKVFSVMLILSGIFLTIE